MMLSEKKIDAYMRRAEVVAQNSHDSETKVGAILINGKSGAVIADGTNGFVRKAPDDQLPTTRPDKYEFMIHAEMNLLCNAARHGISTDDCIVVLTHSPCKLCARMLYQAGICNVIYHTPYTDLDRSMKMGDLNISCFEIGEHIHMVITPFLEE